MKLEDRSLRLTPKRIEALHRLGINDTDGVLSYYPFRYDIMNVRPFEEWKEKDKVFFEGEILKTARTWRHGRKSSTVFEAEAYDRVLKITIYNRPWASNLAMNQRIFIQGIYMGKNRVTAVSYDTKPIAEHAAVTPVYSVKEGIRQQTVRACVERVYETVQNEIRDIVPEEFIRRYRLLRKADALRRIHFPSNPSDIEKAARTLKYEEFLRFFTAVQLLKNSDADSLIKEAKHFDGNLILQAAAKLPYKLTKGQADALNDVLRDMSSPKPMYRLVQGDVGCGKTVVAALALYADYLSGFQGALLAPTEILARQHLISLRETLSDTGVRIELLCSGISAAERKTILEDTSSGKIDILVGTHSLIQDDVTFKKLGLVAADEQQRFGVEQRRKLRAKGVQTDFLLMSATPIPRTLASALFGDMDVSTIETMPSGRRPPVTALIRENSFRSVLSDVRKLLDHGRQLYVICAAVDQNEEYHARNVYDTANALQVLFSDLKVGVLHGKMTSAEKQSVMEAFAADEIQVLVSTTVVEVGMNVVNATGMIVYDADRFGLSQLHQLRGRVQRGSEQGYCWLLTGSDDPKTLERLEVLVKTNDGFVISYEDLRLRGPGDILGTRQSGVPDFILGNVTEDTNVINTSRKDAEWIVSHRDNPDYAAVIDSVNAGLDGASGYRD